MTIETRKLVISEKLKRKVEMVCRFANVKYTIINGNIKSIKNTNIAMFKPHIVKIKGIDYLIFDDCDDIFINSYKEIIKFKGYELYNIYEDVGISAKNDKRPAYQEMMQDVKDKKLIL